MRKAATNEFGYLKEVWPRIILRSNAAELINEVVPGFVTIRSLENYDQRGTGCPRVRLGRKIGYRRDDLIKWLEDQFRILN